MRMGRRWRTDHHGYRSAAGAHVIPLLAAANSAGQKQQQCNRLSVHCYAGIMTRRQKAPSVTYTYLIPAPHFLHQWCGAVTLARRNDSGSLTCVTCHREFSSLHDFVVHQRRHTGERPFQCSRCFQSFASASALLLHRGSDHGSRSPFRCTFCGRSFDGGDAYSRHLGTHRSAGYCFRCSCTRLFRYETEIKAHLDMHHSGRGYKCSYCRRVYESRRLLGAHLRKHEKNGTPPKPHGHR